MTALAGTLTLGCPQGYVRVFADEGRRWPRCWAGWSGPRRQTRPPPGVSRSDAWPGCCAHSAAKTTCGRRAGRRGGAGPGRAADRPGAGNPGAAGRGHAEPADRRAAGGHRRHGCGSPRTRRGAGARGVRRRTSAAALAARTEGWAAGLRWAALPVRGQADPAGFAAAFSGSHRYVLDYLAEEVLDRQAEELRAFLLEPSLLECLSGGLCDAVTGRDGSQASPRNWWSASTRSKSMSATYSANSARPTATRPSRARQLGLIPNPAPQAIRGGPRYALVGLLARQCRGPSAEDSTRIRTFG